MSGFIKYFNNGGKNMPFIIKDDILLIKYSEVWGKIKRLLGIKLHSEPIYDNKYIKSRLRSFNDETHTTFWVNKISKESIHYTYIAVIIIDSIMRMDKKYSPQHI